MDHLGIVVAKKLRFPWKLQTSCQDCGRWT